MLKKILAKLGKGSTQVDLTLDQSEYQLGDHIFGQIHIKGGSVTQFIRKIEVELTLNMHVKEHLYTQFIHSIVFDEPFEVKPSYERQFPFSFELPINLLVSGSHVSYHFITHLDIVGGVDNSDRDPIVIHPPTHLQNILVALERLGFLETHNSRSFNGFSQEFQLVPTLTFRDQIQEIEFSVVFEDHGIRLLFEVNRYDFLGETEIRKELFLEKTILDEIEQLTAFFEKTLTDMIHASSIHHIDKKHFQNKSLSSKVIGGVAIGFIAAEAVEEVIDEIDDEVEDDFEDPFNEEDDMDDVEED